jgi:MFS family permease
MVGLSISVAALMSLTIDPQQSLTSVLIHLGAIGLGIGTVYPVATVAVQNAVPRHQLGIATGTMNFFRALLSAVIVAGLGAIILGGINVKGGGGEVASVLQASGGSAEIALVFRWVFAACSVIMAFALLWLILMEERPLPGRADIPVAAAPPAPAAE